VVFSTIVCNSLIALTSLGVSVATYLASYADVVPDRRWGTANTPITLPKAVIYPNYGYANYDSVTSDAATGITAQLKDARIFAGSAGSVALGVNAGRHSLIHQGLPWHTVDEVLEPLTNLGGTVSVFSKTFTPTNARGGDVFYVSLADSDGSGRPPYFSDDSIAWEDFDLLKAADLAFLQACYPKHRRVRWLAVVGIDSSVIRGGVYDGDKTQSVLTQLNTDWAEYGFKAVTVTGWMKSSSAARNEAITKSQNEILDFFDL